MLHIMKMQTEKSPSGERASEGERERETLTVFSERELAPPSGTKFNARQL